MSDKRSVSPVPSGNRLGSRVRRIALPDTLWIDQWSRSSSPFEPVGEPRAILPPVVAGEAVEREEIGILEVDGARILVGNVEVGGRRGKHELEARRDPLRPAERPADQRPATSAASAPMPRCQPSSPR